MHHKTAFKIAYSLLRESHYVICNLDMDFEEVRHTLDANNYLLSINPMAVAAESCYYNRAYPDYHHVHTHAEEYASIGNIKGLQS